MLMNVLFTNPVETMELASMAKGLIRVLARKDGKINIVKQVFVKHIFHKNPMWFFFVTSNEKLYYLISEQIVVIYNIRHDMILIDIQFFYKRRRRM